MMLSGGYWEIRLSFNYTYSKEISEYKGCLQLYNFDINQIGCIFPSIMDILDRIMHDYFVEHISDLH